jgi:biotin operon repressor
LTSVVRPLPSCKNEIMKDYLAARELKYGEFFWLDKAVIQQYVPKIGNMGMIVYTFLASFADTEQKCFPSQEYIAAHLGCSRSTVWRAIKSLEKYGLVKKRRRDRYRCEYLLLKIDKCKLYEHRMLQGCNGDVSRTGTNNNELSKNINNIDKRKYLESKLRAYKAWESRH